MSVLARRLISTLLATAASVLVLWWLLSDGMGDSLLNALHSAHLWPLALGGLIAIQIQMIRAWRFAILTNGDLCLPSWTMVGIATKLVVFNFLLPFKLGELSFPLMMKRAFATPFGQGAGILILCRFLDFGVVAAMILLTAAWLLDPVVHGWNSGLISALGLVALIMPFVIANRLPRTQRMTAHWPRIDHLARQMSHGASMMSPPRQFALVTTLTLMIWVAHAVIAWLAAISIAAGIDFVSMTMASASSNLAFALPISGVAGLGPPQAAWATMLHLAGHDWPPAIASALICHGVLLVTLSLFGAAFWIGQALGAKTTGNTDASDRGPSFPAGGS